MDAGLAYLYGMAVSKDAGGIEGDNVNGSRRKLGGSRLVRYRFALPASATCLQVTKI